ncbi:MAG: hypothetical protein K5739_03335 [Lachnospiraceae bacterium]|nr:hypothetical protein [Lachnospiraceae bacterium]
MGKKGREKWLRYSITALACGLDLGIFVLITCFHRFPDIAQLVIRKNKPLITRLAYEDFSYDTSLVLFGILSAVFVGGRLWHAIKEGSKNSLELWESYPVTRKKRIMEEIKNALSLPLAVGLISVIGSTIIETVHGYLAAKPFAGQGIETLLMDPCFVATMLLSVLYCSILMMIALLVEIVMTNRLISFLTGAVLFLAANILCWSKDAFPVPSAIVKEGVSYFEIPHLMPFPTTVYMTFCAGIIFLLYIVCVKAYEKRELSANGLFYFSSLKDIFLVLIALLVLAAGGFFGAFGSRGNPGSAYVWVAAEVSALLILANFLSESPDRRRHWKRLVLSTGRIMLLFAAATCGIITVTAGESNLIFTGQTEAENDYNPYCEETEYGSMRCELERYYDMDEIPVMLSGITEDLVIRQSKRFGTAFCEKWDEWNCVNVFQYNEQLNCMDSYVVWSMDSVDEIIAFIDTDLQPAEH